MKKINMKIISGRSVLNLTLAAVLFSLFMFSDRVYAQNIPLSELTSNKYAFQNLQAALSSDNCGIKRCAVYLIGKLKIAEGEDLIEEMIHNEKDPCNKMLAALVLLELNKAKGISELKKLGESGLNEDAKKLALFTYYQHIINDEVRKKD
jgi:hypothetical protein